MQQSTQTAKKPIRNQNSTAWGLTDVNSMEVTWIPYHLSAVCICRRRTSANVLSPTFTRSWFLDNELKLLKSWGLCRSLFNFKTENSNYVANMSPPCGQVASPCQNFPCAVCQSCGGQKQTGPEEQKRGVQILFLAIQPILSRSRKSRKQKNLNFVASTKHSTKCLSHLHTNFLKP